MTITRKTAAVRSQVALRKASGDLDHGVVSGTEGSGSGFPPRDDWRWPPLLPWRQSTVLPGARRPMRARVFPERLFSGLIAQGTRKSTLLPGAKIEGKSKVRGRTPAMGDRLIINQGRGADHAGVTAVMAHPRGPGK